MTVATILNEKGRDVAKIGQDASVSDVARALAAAKVGALVVTGESGGVVGIVSERDIIRAIAQSGPDCLMQAVSGIMTRTVVSCGPGETVDAVMRKMTSGRFRHMPVMEDGALVGIISIGDVVKTHIAEVELEAQSLKSYIAS